MEKYPFPDLLINSSAFLDELNGRSTCSKCSRSRKYYCYSCYLPVPELVSLVPKIRLPIKIDIIKHPSEVSGKSTAVHAGVIAPDDVTIYTYPCIPDYEDKNKVVLVFPGKDAVTLTDLAIRWNVREVQNIEVSSNLKRKLEPCENGLKDQLKKSKKIQETENADLKSECNTDLAVSSEQASAACAEDNASKNGEKSESQSRGAEGVEGPPVVPGCPLERVVFVDSTWNQTKAICNDERLKGLTHVELQTRKTKFWRHQKDIPDTYLSTIEAIYYFVCDFHEHFVQTEYHGEYDNLLFFFTYMYNKIRSLYDGGEDLKAYKNRKANAQQD